MDNPCLSRSLIADFTNSRCYKQTSTIVNYNYYWVRQETSYGEAAYGACGYYSTAPCFSCSESTVGRTQIHATQPEVSNDGYKFLCSRAVSSYTCPASYPIKINNATCEYREAF